MNRNIFWILLMVIAVAYVSFTASPTVDVKQIPDMIRFTEGVDLSAATKWLCKYWIAD